MLLRSFLACGAQRLFLNDPSYGEEKASHYYEAATQDLMSAMQDPNRDSVLCAVASLALSVFEALSPKQAQTNHIMGSRALIHECGWTAKTSGLGGACFWISVGMELLSCLHHGWTLSWDPDTWGVDMDMAHIHSLGKGEDIWFHRILYICAKIANFRVSKQQLLSSTGSSMNTAQFHDTMQEWNLYSAWGDQWEQSIPQSMKPLGHLQPWQTGSRSSFPTIWYVRLMHFLYCPLADPSLQVTQENSCYFSALLPYSSNITSQGTSHAIGPSNGNEGDTKSPRPRYMWPCCEYQRSEHT